MAKCNREVFVVDPTGRRLPNDGVTALDAPTTDDQLSVLRYELESFVARGEYGEGMRRILSSYVSQVEQGVQPAVWVSGFYGSGKSHFLRVLTYLWANPDVQGASARSLVGVPDDVGELLKEVDAYAKRVRTVTFAAAGVMRRKKGSSVAQPLLEIILTSAGMPTKYAPASFTLWLKETPGRYEDFLEALRSRGKGPDEVTRNLFVSSAIREAVLDVIPDFATSPEAAAEIIAAEYRTKDVSDDMVVETIRRVLEAVARESDYGDKATMPLTLLVLDELQQYISDDVQMLLEIQNLIERLTKQFQGRLLVVAAGQSALSANDVLARFMDRFTVQVQLQSKDVDTVVREVVLRKKPEETPSLESALDVVSGEILRQLPGSKIAPSAADKSDLVPDYPLLPARRRFMESVLRAVDRGAAGQLRSQLRVTLEAVAEVAGLPIGNVVAGDVVFRSKKTDMVNQGVLLGDLNARIATVDDGTADGNLRARAAQVIFLISHLDPTEGVRPTAGTLADLLVTDLNDGSAQLRQRLPGLLADLEGDLLVLDGDEYRLQSPEDAEWESAYRRARGNFINNTSEQLQARGDALRRAVDHELGAIRVVHGNTHTPRKVDVHFAPGSPTLDDTSLTVWIQTGWDQKQTQVATYARQAGLGDSVIYVWLPKENDQELKEAIAIERAARSVVNTQPPPGTEEGKQARDQMNGRAVRAQEQIDELALQIVNNSNVYLGGGSQPSGKQKGLASNVTAALDAATARKFNRFDLADHAGWPTVFKRAKEGNPDALQAVGYNGDVLQSPVAKLIISSLAGGSRTGLDIRKEFQAAPFGWPKDAVYGALAALVQTEHLEAKEGAAVIATRDLTETSMGKLTFNKQTTVLTFSEKQQLKKLMAALGIAPDDLESGVRASLHALKQAARAAGGEEPLPPVPDTSNIDTLLGGSGATRQQAVAQQVESLLADLDRWNGTHSAIACRCADWDEAQRLLGHAIALPVHDECEATLRAIQEQRSLMIEPNPVRPVTQKLEEALRRGLADAHSEEVAARNKAVAEIESRPEWTRLEVAERGAFLASHGLGEPAEPKLSASTQLLAELDDMSLGSRHDRVFACPGKASEAAADLVKQFVPQAKTVRPKPATLETAVEAKKYVQELEAEILAHIAAGSPVSIQN